MISGLKTQRALFDAAKRSIGHKLGPRVRAWDFDAMMTALKREVNWDTLAGRNETIKKFASEQLGFQDERQTELQGWLCGTTVMPVEYIVHILRTLNKKIYPNTEMKKPNEEEDFEKAKAQISPLPPDVASWDIARAKEELRKVVHKGCRTSIDRSTSMRSFVRREMRVPGVGFRRYAAWLSGRGTLDALEYEKVLLTLIENRKPAPSDDAETALQTPESKHSGTCDEIAKAVIDSSITQLNHISDFCDRIDAGKVVNEGDREEVRRVLTKFCTSFNINVIFPLDNSKFPPVPKGDLARTINETPASRKKS
jgi:hypothetical protein